MTAEQYEHILRAALAMKRSKYNLAEALVQDIPPAPAGSNDGAITSALEEVATQIVDMGGDEIAVDTLRGYRLTALWVQANGTDAMSYQWREGSSFTAHLRAARGGMEWSEFAKLPRTTRDVQKMLGNKASVGSTSAKVDEMTQTERVDMARALADAEPDIVTDAVVETQRKAVVEAAERTKEATPTPTHKEPSTSTANLRRYEALEDVISRNITFTGLIIGRWETELEALAGYMSPEKYRAIANHLDAAAQKYTDLIDLLETRAEDKEARV